MQPQTRQKKLVEAVRLRGKVSVEDLAALLDASRETIRRDLAHLAEAGRILKVHGGAQMPLVSGEGPFKQRLSENVGAKMEIGKRAASLFAPGATLFIDTGSTTQIFVEALANVGGLTVVTNSTEIARSMTKARNGSRVFLVGGEFSLDNSQTIGSMAIAQIRQFRAHHAVLTVGAIDGRSGAMDYNIEEALIARAMIEQSEKVTVLADGSKFQALATFEVCPLSRIDRLVSEVAPPEDIRRALEEAGGVVVEI